MMSLEKAVNHGEHGEKQREHEAKPTPWDGDFRANNDSLEILVFLRALRALRGFDLRFF